MKQVARGFTLIELMITVAIVGILMAVAVPMYKDYVMRARLGEAFTALSGVQLDAEQYWATNKTYATKGSNNFPTPASTPNFDYAVSNQGTGTFLVTATGKNSATNFKYTIDQSGNRTSTTTLYGNSATCWVDRKGSVCTQ